MFGLVNLVKRRMGKGLLAVVAIVTAMRGFDALAAPPRGAFDQDLVVANDGALWGGSIATFSAGSKGNSAPKYLNILLNDVAQQFSGVAVSPKTGENFVVESFGLAVLEFSPTANARKLPQSRPQVIIDGDNTGLVFPEGVAFDSKQDPIVDTSGQFYVANNCSTLPKSGNYCSSMMCTTSPDEIDGKVTVFNAGARGNAAPNLTIEGCNTSLGGPIGIFVDEATVSVCIGSAATAADLCNPANGNVIVPVPTRRIWVVNDEAVDNNPDDLAFGTVTIYAPELAFVLSLSNCADNPQTGQPVCDEAPLGGMFSTAGEGDTPDFTSIPQFIAVNQDESSAYVTDADFGRVKAFDLTSAPNCMTTDAGGNCRVAIDKYITGAYRASIFGRHTLLKSPLGVSVKSTAEGDELFVADLRNRILEFGPQAALNGGDLAPIAQLKGGRTRLNEPIGVAVSPPQLIP